MYMNWAMFDSYALGPRKPKDERRRPNRTRPYENVFSRRAAETARALLDPAFGTLLRRQIVVAPVGVVLALVVGESDGLDLRFDLFEALGDVFLFRARKI